MKRFFAVTVLAVALCVPVFAGDMDHPLDSPPITTSASTSVIVTIVTVIASLLP
ncbi:MAG: hypothetical protein ACR2LC_09515 [Pyrinomonadaceae bacterium]